MYSVFLGLPHYGTFEPSALEGLILASASHRYQITPRGSSMLCDGFNMLLAECLNGRDKIGWTHFAMQHSDIKPAEGWIDTLLEEMDRVNADIISVVSPIKDARGLTTTGYMDPGTKHITRYTMREIHALPETFGAEVCAPNWLMVNTGLWIARISAFEHTLAQNNFPGFETRTSMRKIDGVWQCFRFSEDWNMSLWAATVGLRVFATRKVGLTHWGQTGYSNETGWGVCTEDRNDAG
jgi:hypothetical protein